MEAVRRSSPPDSEDRRSARIDFNVIDDNGRWKEAYVDNDANLASQF